MCILVFEFSFYREKLEIYLHVQQIKPIINLDEKKLVTGKWEKSFI